MCPRCVFFGGGIGGWVTQAKQQVCAHIHKQQQGDSIKHGNIFKAYPFVCGYVCRQAVCADMMKCSCVWLCPPPPQEDTFVPTMTCQETLAFYGGVTLGGAKWNRASRRERVEEVLAAVGLAHTAHTLVRPPGVDAKDVC